MLGNSQKTLLFWYINYFQFHASENFGSYSQGSFFNYRLLLMNSLTDQKAFNPTQISFDWMLKFWDHDLRRFFFLFLTRGSTSNFYTNFESKSLFENFYTLDLMTFSFGNPGAFWLYSCSRHQRNSRDIKFIC